MAGDERGRGTHARTDRRLTVCPWSLIVGLGCSTAPPPPRTRPSPGLVKALTAAKDWARNEQEWLRLNQPRDCYRDLHGVWSTVIGRLGEAFAVLESAFADGDMQELLRGQRLAEQVTVFMGQHAESAAPVLCAGAPAGEDVSTHG